jgi:hypothetical protein
VQGVKQAKLPPISENTKILCFDLEANGLHGQIFAVGAVVTDSSGHVYERFTARCDIREPVNDWIAANVIPVIGDMPHTHASYEAMREAFWEWYLRVEPTADYVLVSNGYPIEYKFLLDCQAADIETRYWQHPYPILDLTSLLVQVTGKSVVKSRLVNTVKKNGDFRQHHPLDDAKVTAMLAFEAFKLAGRL